MRNACWYNPPDHVTYHSAELFEKEYERSMNGNYKNFNKAIGMEKFQSKRSEKGEGFR